MLDYVTKMALLEAVRAYTEGEFEAVIWLEQNLSNLYTRWRELDAKGK